MSAFSGLACAHRNLARVVAKAIMPQWVERRFPVRPIVEYGWFFVVSCSYR